MSLLYGLHDEEGASVVPSDGWCLALVSLSDNPNGKDYTAIRSDINWIHRINWGYGSTGTIPKPDQDGLYIERLVKFINASRGIERIIIGNEPNHEQERPQSQVITPERYVQFYNRIYLATNTLVQIAPAPVAPYHASPMDCMHYWRQVLGGISGADFLVGHAYVRSTNGNAIYDETRMQAPLLGQFYAFYTYRDQLSAVPNRFRHLPFHITEFCPVDGWEDKNTGLIRNAFSEINWWNQLPQSQKIHSLHPYRYPTYDKWGMEGKGNLMDDYQDAIGYGLSIDTEGQGEPLRHEVRLPTIKAPESVPSPSTPFERKLDERAIKRGVSIQETDGAVWRVKEVQWYDEQQADAIGPDRNILLDALDENGKRVEGQTFIVSWPTGFNRVSITKTEPLYGADYPMSPSRNEYSVRIADEISEVVTGIGMGQDTPSGFNPGTHTSTRVVFQKVVGKSVEIPKESPISTPVPGLSYPVFGSFQGEISQLFGENPEIYKRFVVAGVPLRGHNGLDFAVPVGTNVYSVDSGRVVEVAEDQEGYGKYVKILHPWGESLYAHLAVQTVELNETVIKGQLLGMSGNTGYSTGPHLHLGIRVNSYNRADGWGGYSDPLPLLKREVVKPISTYDDVVDAIRAASVETGIDLRLLLSLAWAESSFRPDIKDGLYQLGDDAWNDHSGGLPLSQRNNLQYNALVGAKYLKWLLNYFNQDLDKSLVSWNYGIGNVIDEEEVPQITWEFVNKVKHGRDLLRAVDYD